MKFAKSYQLLNFLNRSHSRANRLFFGSLASLGVVVVTRSGILASEVWRSIQRNHYKNAFRRCGWYAANGWPRLQIVKDPFFDFTDGLTESEIDAARRFNQRSSHRAPSYQVLSNELYALAAKIHLMLAASDDGVSVLVDEFYRVADELVKNLPEVKKTKKKPITQKHNSQFIADARAALLAFSNLFPSQEWKWYVISGTFLGLVRENGFLSHDIDIDLGVNHEDFDFQGFMSVLSKTSGFVVKKIDEQIEIYRERDDSLAFRKRLCLIKLIHESGINIDVFVHHKDGNIRWHGSSIHRWENHEYKLTPCTLEGIPVCAPDNADLYLTENYGDWKTPKYNFNCSTDTNNLVVTRNFLSIAIFLKRMAFFMASKPTEGLLLRNALIKHQVLVSTKEGLRVTRYI